MLVKKLVAPVLFAVLAVVALMVYLKTSGDQRLDNSVAVLWKGFGSVYEVQKKKHGESFIDLSGVWLIRTESNLSDEALRGARFFKADDADLQYFKQLVIDALGEKEALDGYALYRAQQALGDGTICSAAPCSIYILIQEGSALAYVGVYKL